MLPLSAFVMTMWFLLIFFFYLQLSFVFCIFSFVYGLRHLSFSGCCFIISFLTLFATSYLMFTCSLSLSWLIAIFASVAGVCNQSLVCNVYQIVGLYFIICESGIDYVFSAFIKVIRVYAVYFCMICLVFQLLYFLVRFCV
jgi:hypothetical protein